MDLPFVSWVCPTFHRPKLLRNLLACYLAQDYPKDKTELVILDDGYDFAQQSGDGWVLNSQKDRYPSLPDKYNALLGLCDMGTELFVVAEDDDIYLPHHTSSYVEAWRRNGDPIAFIKPSKILSAYTGEVKEQGGAGRFHASIGLSRSLVELTGGWVKTKAADFDQQLMRLCINSVKTIIDPCESSTPSYCFRYGSTQAYHGQHFMRGSDDEEWYDRVPRVVGNGDLLLTPEFDHETRMVFQSHSTLKIDPAPTQTRRYPHGLLGGSQ